MGQAAAATRPRPWLRAVLSVGSSRGAVRGAMRSRPGIDRPVGQVPRGFRREHNRDGPLATAATGRIDQPPRTGRFHRQQVTAIGRSPPRSSTRTQRVQPLCPCAARAALPIQLTDFQAPTYSGCARHKPTVSSSIPLPTSRTLAWYSLPLA